jgi:hypothetical protein
MRSFLTKVLIGIEEEEEVIDDRPSMIALQSAPVVHDIAFGYGVSTVVLTDTESVAQVRIGCWVYFYNNITININMYVFVYYNHSFTFKCIVYKCLLYPDAKAVPA